MRQFNIPLFLTLLMASIILTGVAFVSLNVGEIIEFVNKNSKLSIGALSNPLATNNNQQTYIFTKEMKFNENSNDVLI
ncbi:MAG: hypothetical protein AAB352_02015, partial [Patescibacteria group bacterium]